VLANSHSLFASPDHASRLPSARLHLRPVGVICGQTPSSMDAVSTPGLLPDLCFRPSLTLCPSVQAPFAPITDSAPLAGGNGTRPFAMPELNHEMLEGTTWQTSASARQCKESAVHSVFRITARAVRILRGSSPFDRPRSRFAEFLSAPGSGQLIEPMKRLRLRGECGSMFSVRGSPAYCIACPFRPSFRGW
jgi:hypothetical protein